MSQSITAVYQDRHSATRALESLTSHGLREKDISVLMSQSTRGKEFAVEVNSKAPEGALAGAATGGAIGAIAAGLTSVGTIAATGGVGLVAAGPIVAAMAGGGAGAATGGLLGGLVGFGIDENEAKLVDKDIQNGSILIAAQVPDEWKKDIKNALENTGAKKITVH